MTKYLRETLKQAKGIYFYHAELIGSTDYVLLDFDNPSNILTEYRDLATLFDFERWQLVLEAIVKDRLKISLITENETVSIENLTFSRSELENFLKNVPRESNVGLTVGEGQTRMTDHFGFVAKLRGYSTSGIIDDQLQ